MDTGTKRWLTTTELAHLLEVSEATVRRWARQKRLPHFRSPGGHYRFDVDEIYRFVENRRVTCDELLAHRRPEA
jgi:excisionase family DNA binding protein